MRRIKKLEANGIYMIITKCTKRSCFFENTSQIRLFKNQFSRHLDGICNVLMEFYKPCGYVYIVKIESEESIKNTYLRKRRLSKKAKKETRHSEIWRMVSEQFRLAGSTYVSIANRRDRSSGTRFKRNYERYLIENEEELNLIIKLIESENVSLDQESTKYQLDSSLKKNLLGKISKVQKINKLVKVMQVKRVKIFKKKLFEVKEEVCWLKRHYLFAEKVLGATS